MANPSILQGDHIVRGHFTSDTMTIPAQSVPATAVQTNAKVEYSKLEHLHVFRYRQWRRATVHHISTPIQNIDNGAGTTVDRAVHYFAKAGKILSARIVYDIETAGTVAAGNSKLGVTLGGAEVVAATAYTNSATVGSKTDMTIVDGAIDAGETLFWRHTGVVATPIAGECHLEIQYLEYDDTVHDDTANLHIVYGVDGDIESVEVSAATAPTSSSSFTVDVQKWEGSTWTSVLSSVITVSSGTMTSDKAIVAGTVTDSDFVDGNLLRIVVTPADQASTQAQGVVVTIRASEKALTT